MHTYQYREVGLLVCGEIICPDQVAQELLHQGFGSLLVDRNSGYADILDKLLDALRYWANMWISLILETFMDAQMMDFAQK